MKIGTQVSYFLDVSNRIETKTTSEVYELDGKKVVDIHGHKGADLSMVFPIGETVNFGYEVKMFYGQIQAD